MVSLCRRFIALVTPSSRRLPLPLPFSFLPSPVYNAAVVEISAVLSLILMPSSCLVTAAKSSQVRASTFAAAVANALLFWPSYHKPILHQRRGCHLVAAISAIAAIADNSS